MLKTILMVVLYATAGIFAATGYTTTIKTGEDCFIMSAKPLATPGSNNQLMAGQSSFSSRGQTKTLIRIDLSDIADNFTTVTAAKLRLYLLSTDNIAFTNDTLKIYKISAANRNWTAGSGTLIGDSVPGAACWKWKAYDNTSYSAENTACPGCLRRFPWAGDSTAWNNGQGTLGSVAGGLSVSGVDYEATPVGTALISSSQINTFIEIPLTSTSFFKEWADNSVNNAGFLITLGRVDATKRDCATFASFNHATLDFQPQLEISFSDWTGVVTKTIDYNFPTAGRVSMLIRDDKKVVKELLWARQESGGLQHYTWDGRDLQGTIVADGHYTAKILQTQGLTAEYMGVIGISSPYYEGWIGNHVAPLSLAVDDTAAVYIAGGGQGTPSVLKMQRNGNRIWTSADTGDIPVQAGQAVVATASDSGKLYLLTTDAEIRMIDNDVSPATYTNLTSGIIANTLARSELVFAIDMDVRNGKMVTATAYTNELQWRSVATGDITSSVTVTDIAGVALANNGKALVISGNQILAFTEGNSTPATLVGSGLTVPYRLSVNRRNGDIYVSELGTFGVTGHQVKRFNQNGVLQATYGKMGGRKQSGTWQPDSGFRSVLDIAVVSSDSSFWICEGLNYSGVRRQAHYDKNGHIIQEWFGGSSYATQASADPEDPSIVWVDGDQHTLYRVRMNWQTKKWTMLGTYTYTGPELVESAANEGQRWSVRKHSGKTYLARTLPPEILYFDEANDRLTLVSKASTAWFVRYSSTVNAAADYPGQENTRMFSWYDHNNDGAVNAGEWTWTPDNMVFGTWFNVYNQKYLGPDKNCNYYPFYPEGPDNWSYGHTWGVGILSPEWTTVGGVEIPVYNWLTGHRFVTPEVEAVSKTGSADQYRSFNDSCVFPGRADDYIGDNTGIFAYSEAGAVADDSGNVFCSMYAGTGTQSDHFMAKWDKNGLFEWAVGKKIATAGVQPAGSIARPDHLLGTAKGCVALADYRGDLNYVWNQDGLYVGNMFEQIHANSAALPAAAFTICDEQFTGEIFEVKTSETPGLNKGDVLFFAPGYNSAPVYRISGWDNFISRTVDITVSGGIVTNTGVIKQQSASARLACSAISIVNTAVPVISVFMGQSGNVTIALYSVQGRRIQELARGPLSAGTHRFPIGQRLPAGIYFVRVLTGDMNTTAKLCLP